MGNPLAGALHNLFDTTTWVGALTWAVVLFALTGAAVRAIRRLAHHVEERLSDPTGLRFASAFVQVLVYLVGLILYANLIPRLHSLGTALLAGASVASIVLGLAAQNTLGNLIAGLSLVLYRPFRDGDTIQLAAPKGLVTARVESISLGYTVLRDPGGDEIMVPNSVMASSIVVRVAGTGASGD
jgi:small-conductance mechanosensitive channel